MKIIIDIPEEDFGWNGKLNICRCSFERLIQIVSNGTPLPKGHGDLIDRNELLNESYQIDSMYCIYDEVVNVDDIKNAPTIIEGSDAE